MQDDSGETVCFCSRTGQADREDDSNLTSHFPSSIVVPGAPTPEEPGHAKVPVIRGFGDIDPGSFTGTRMVVHQEEPGEWEELTYPRPGYDCGDRCIHAGVGSCLQGCANWRSMVSGRAVKSHQLPRAVSSYLCSEGIYKEQAECSGTPTHGQLNSRSLCKPHGRNPFPSNEQTSNPALAMVLGEESVPVNRIPTRSRQLCSRQGIQGDTLVSRVATPPGSFPADNGNLQEMHSGPLRLQAQCPTRTVCEI